MAGFGVRAVTSASFTIKGIRHFANRELEFLEEEKSFDEDGDEIYFITKENYDTMRIVSKKILRDFYHDKLEHFIQNFESDNMSSLFSYLGDKEEIKYKLQMSLASDNELIKWFNRQCTLAGYGNLRLYTLTFLLLEMYKRFDMRVLFKESLYPGLIPHTIFKKIFLLDSKVYRIYKHEEN